MVSFGVNFLCFRGTLAVAFPLQSDLRAFSGVYSGSLGSNDSNPSLAVAAPSARGWDRVGRGNFVEDDSCSKGTVEPGTILATGAFPIECWTNNRNLSKSQLYTSRPPGELESRLTLLERGGGDDWSSLGVVPSRREALHPAV